MECTLRGILQAHFDAYAEAYRLPACALVLVNRAYLEDVLVDEKREE